MPHDTKSYFLWDGDRHATPSSKLNCVQLASVYKSVQKRVKLTKHWNEPVVQGACDSNHHLQR